MKTIDVRSEPFDQCHNGGTVHPTTRDGPRLQTDTTMDEQTAVLNFSDFIIRHGVHSHYLNEGFAFRELSPVTWSGSPESFAHLHSILFVYEGSLNIRLDGRPYVIPRNGFSDVIDLVSLEITGMSDDLRAIHLLFTENFLGDLIKNRPPFPFSYMQKMNENPVWVIPESNRTDYLNRLETIGSVMRNASHHFQPEMLRSAFWMFLLEVTNLYLQRAETGSDGEGPDRMRSLFLRFMYMLPRHVCENHSVGFYASQLCITPQYLNRVVRRISGHSVSDTINRILTREIVKLLENKDLSIQEIADRLCFADQATMSKFFKRQKGLSPTAYRQKGS